MKFQKASNLIKTKPLKPYILFYGEEDYLKQEGIRTVLQTLELQTPELNLSLFEGRTDGHQIATAMETLPFMDRHRAIVLRNTDLLSSKAAASLTMPLVQAKLPESNVLIVSAGEKIDRRKALYKKIKTEGWTVNCAPLTDNELIIFAMDWAKRKNVELNRADAQLLAEYSGGELFTVVNELEKLSVICEKSIDRAAIEKYVSQSMQFNIFRIHDLMRTGKLCTAKNMIDRLLLDDPNPIGFIGLIAGNFKQMLVARACLDAGFTQQKAISHVVEETGAQQWLAKRSLSNSKDFTLEQLQRGVKKLGRIDFMAKQGEIVMQTDLFPLLTKIYCS